MDLSYSAEDLAFRDEVRAYLAENGVALGATIIRGGAEGEGPGIHIRDPEGNPVELKGPPDPAYN